MVSTAGKSTPIVTTKRVLTFAEAYKYFDGNRAVMREVLGGKGAGLAEMTVSKVNVPPGITITTDSCRQYSRANNVMPKGLMAEVKEKLALIESQVGRKLGDESKPLLVSVRSGAKFSMPGMMDTILNLGMNDKTMKGVEKMTGNKRFALDSFRRFIQMYANVVLEIAKDKFEDLIEDKKDEHGIKSDTDLTEADLLSLIQSFKALVLDETGKPFPEDADEQLNKAIEAVFKSWNNSRAVYWRNLNNIDHNLGTAVNIQAMVFGNMDTDSATGVCFTRNPSTGERALYGEYLVCAQGEDVVAGTRTPVKISEMAKQMPNVYADLVACAENLETYYRDMQDIEFTVEQGKLYLLQTRSGKRTAKAAVKIAVDMVDEKIISQNEALTRIEPLQLNQLLLPSFDQKAKAEAKHKGALLAQGLNASPGAAIGQIVFDPDESERLAQAGQKVILVRVETCPDDIHGIVPAQGVVTSRGGMTSHAAVVARGMGKPCVAGCEAFRVDLAKKHVIVNGITLKQGDVISIDGSTGEIFQGPILTHNADLSGEFTRLLQFADQIRVLGVRANADTPEDAKIARDFGAEGIGLCRTEHMFMSPERLPSMQKMILARSDAERKQALNQLLPMQRKDFVGIFTAMAGLPVTIRLLDPPLHEFLPKLEELIHEVATMKASGAEEKAVREKELLLHKVSQLKEANPMMGLRGCRLGLLYPDISKMQVQAIFEAAVELKQKNIDVLPEIMIPLVGHVNELKVARAQLEDCARSVMEKAKCQISYKFGTMIEIPRACLTANEIAEYAEFFSFGTNDLTQMTFGFSRDDAEGKFLVYYLEGIESASGKEKILAQNPFEVLDRQGVGKLMKIAVEYGLETRPDLKLGICGEHGGEPSSIVFAHQIGLHYVSCSPYRVPIARLAGAQAALNIEESDK